MLTTDKVFNFDLSVMFSKNVENNAKKLQEIEIKTTKIHQ